MDEEVHGFAADNVPGIPYDRQTIPYGYNGNLNKYPEPKPKKKSLHQKHHKHRDIAERKMEEEVHGFAADNVPGIPYERSPLAPGYNGNRDVWKMPETKKKSSLNQYKKHKKWVAERNMDPYVYDFVAPEVDALTHNLTYDKKDWSVYEYDGPFDYNGQNNLYDAPAAK